MRTQKLIFLFPFFIFLGVLFISVPKVFAETHISGDIDTDTIWTKENNPKIYELLENEIGPEFYERNQDDMPTKWISKMKNSINLSKNYSTSRMLEEYSSLLYV